MKSEQKTELITKNYWTCWNEKHRHKTKEIADACLTQKSREKKITNNWTNEAIDLLLKRKNEGLTYKEIGQLYNITKGYAYNLVQQFAGRKERQRLRDLESEHRTTLPELYIPRWNSDLPIQGWFFDKYNINNKEDLRSLVERKENPLWSPTGQCVYPGLGIEGFEKVKKWLNSETEYEAYIKLHKLPLDRRANDVPN